MNNNSLMHLSLYKKNSTWAFDDDKKAIIAEPFVLGMSEIITHHVPNKDNCEVIFSKEKFPNCKILTLLNEDSNGGWYIDESESLILCDECGREFSYPNEGQIQQGFGICNKCGTNEDEI